MIETHQDVSKRIGIALSGGGVRAAAFHAGVLRYLAERNMLEHTEHVSSVSGGSLFTGLVFAASKYHWPASNEYLSNVLPKIRLQLTSQSLQWTAIRRLFLNPLNWRFLLSRANVVAKAIEELWHIDVPLHALSETPVWSINGTTGETGRRFRFKGRRMGDYEIGYADTSEITLASAMAVSAAFPGGIGPLALNPDKFRWFKREHWESVAGEKPYRLPFARLHLYDGGLYDNLGIEPLFDVGRQAIKTSGQDRVNYVIVSDAGAALKRRNVPHPLNPARFKRIADIALDQTRALRVRSFFGFLHRNPSSGAYLQLGASPVESINSIKMGKEEIVHRLLQKDWLNQSRVSLAAAYPTTLKRLSDEDFCLLEQHGYETACWNIEIQSHGGSTL